MSWQIFSSDRKTNKKNMKTYNVIINNHKDKEFEKLMFISAEMEELVTNNLATIQNSDKDIDINMHSIANDFSTLELEKKRYKLKQGLYEILVLKYNNSGKGILKRFI